MGMTEHATNLKPLIAELALGKTLSVEQARQAFDIMMSGNATPAQIGGLLMALRVRGETVEEITGGIMTMRDKMLAIKAPEGAVDVVGTGGDSIGTYNISTASGFVVAGAGVPVAKHGNKAVSSKSGAADVLAALGVNLEYDMVLVEKALFEAGMCFMLAPRHHGAMRHVGGARVELATRTIFNLLGPMSNPAGVKRQLVGVYSRDWIEPMANVLRQLGSEHVWVVHGSDGLDEMTTTGPTYVAELKDGEITTFEVTPEDAGLPLANLDDLKGGDAETNALALNALLDGHLSPYRDIVVMNSAATLITAGKAADLKEGAELAARSIDSGAARKVLEKLVEISHEVLPDPEEEDEDDDKNGETSA
jgi:anthranilate phosphoribosyltransferase